MGGNGLETSFQGGAGAITRTQHSTAQTENWNSTGKERTKEKNPRHGAGVFLFLVVRVAKDAESFLAFEALALLLEVQPTKLGPHQARGIRLTGHVPADKTEACLEEKKSWH